MYEIERISAPMYVNFANETNNAMARWLKHVPDPRQRQANTMGTKRKKMRNHFTALVALAAALAANTTSAQVLKLSSDTQLSMPSSAEITSQTNIKPTPLKSPLRTVSREQVVLFEDFDNVPDGERDPETGRYLTIVADHYANEQNVGRYMDPTYTPNSGTWEGLGVYAGQGGSVVLQEPSNSVSGYIAMPLGDYSGDLEVTMRVRARRAFQYSYTGELKGFDNEAGTVFLAAYFGGYDSAKGADCSDNMQKTRVYGIDGWVEVKYTLRNNSASNDGFLSILTDQALEIDWVKVVDKATHLAPPALLPVTDFKEDGFTINWQPTRLAYNYYVDLYKKVYTAESGVDLTYNFNDSQLPEGCTCEDYTMVDDGRNGTTGLQLSQDKTYFETPNYGSKLRYLLLYVKGVCNSGKLSYMEALKVDGLTEDGWEYFGSLAGNQISSDKFVGLEIPEEDLKNKYFALRFYTEGFHKSDSPYEMFNHDWDLILDDINVQTYRPYELAVAQSIRNGLDYSLPTSYTFTGLEPATEYYYTVNSHRLATDNMESTSKPVHALGVAAPALDDNVDFANDAYTVKWTDIVKADSYTVQNYKAITVEENTEEYPILEETFADAEGSDDYYDLKDLGNAQETALDEYADFNGWSGTYNTVGENILGARANGKLVTPPLMATGTGKIHIYYEALGTPGDYMFATFSLSGLQGYTQFREDGTCSGYIELDELQPNERITFTDYSPYCEGIALTSFSLVQDLNQGDITLAWDSEQNIPQGVGSCTFSDLEPNGMYACQAFSHFQHELSITRSAYSERVLLDLSKGSVVGISPLDISDKVNTEGLHEVARYTIDGKPAPADYQGLMIVKMSDGSAKKLINK